MEMRQLLETAATLQWTCRTAAVWIILQQSDVLSLVSLVVLNGIPLFGNISISNCIVRFIFIFGIFIGY